MIREATVNDINAIANIIVSAWQNAYEGIIDPDYPKTMNEERFVGIFHNNIQNDIEKILVFEKEKTILGFISGKLESGNYDSQVVGLYIRPGFQGQGIGSELLKAMKAYFTSKGCVRMIAWTLLGAKNNHFYEERGGNPKEKKQIKIGSVDYPGIVFVFNLSECL